MDQLHRSPGLAEVRSVMATVAVPRTVAPVSGPVAAAWREYLLVTRYLPELRYEEIEPLAWQRLQSQLRLIRAEQEGRSCGA